MQRVRIVVGELFGSPMQANNFPAYFDIVNRASGITAKDLINLCTVLFTYAEEQEARNEQYEANFREIQEILEKLVKEAKPSGMPQNGSTMTVERSDYQQPVNGLTCEVCGKVCASELGLRSHKRSHK